MQEYQKLTQDDFKFLTQMEYAAQNGTHASQTDVDRLLEIAFKISAITDTVVRQNEELKTIKE